MGSSGFRIQHPREDTDVEEAQKGGRNPQGREQESQLARSALSSIVKGTPQSHPTTHMKAYEGDHIPAYSSIPTEQESGPRAVQRRRETEAQLAKRSDRPARSAVNALL